MGGGGDIGGFGRNLQFWLLKLVIRNSNLSSAVPYTYHILSNIGAAKK